MADTDRIDELLSEIGDDGRNTPSHDWSMSDIDALLGVRENPEEEKADTLPPFVMPKEAVPQKTGELPAFQLPKEAVPQKTGELPPFKVPEEQEQKSESEFDLDEIMDSVRQSEKDHQQVVSEIEQDYVEDMEAAEEPAPKKRGLFAFFSRRKNRGFFDFDDEDDEADEEDGEDEEPEEYEASGEDDYSSVISEPGELSRKDAKTLVFDPKSIKAGVKPVSEKTADRVDDELDNSEAIPQDQTQVVMSLADDEDIEYTEVPNKEKSVSARKKFGLAQNTIGITPIHNENIDHQIVSEKVEKSAGTPERDDYTIPVPVSRSNLKHSGPINIGGKTGSKFKNTADLESVPTIVEAAEEVSAVDKTIIAKSGSKVVSRKPDSYFSGQIKINGFGEDEVVEQIDEETAEDELQKNRDQRVAEFKLNPEFEEIDEELEGYEVDSGEERVSGDYANFIDDEYINADDRSRIAGKLAKATRLTFTCGVIQLVLTVVAWVISALVTKSGGSLETVGGGAFGCGIINIIILLIASACGVSTLIRGFNGIVSQKPNASTGTFVVVVACFLELLVVMFFTDGSYTATTLYTGAACLALTIASAARYITLLRVKNNFAFITNGTQLYSTEMISSERDAEELGKGLLINNPAICYNARMERPSYFIENSFEDDPADDYVDKFIYVSLGLAFILAFVFGIIHRSVAFAFGTFAAFTSVGIPAFTLLASNVGLLWKNRMFNKTGAAIVGHRAVEDSTDANAYVFDATDIFKGGSSSIIGIKTFHSMRIDDAILYAAAMVIESGGPLAYIFDGVILGKKDLLPPVESLAYEERLGLSAWIHGRRVLFGTRDLLINHNVETPPKNFESQYTHDGRSVAYLAIHGKIAAMFVIKYQPDENLGKYLRYLDRAGVSILVRSCDCNITEEMICRQFRLPLSAVKVLSPVSGDIFQVYRNEDIETAPAGLINNGTLEASINAFYEARELSDTVYVNKLVAGFYTGMALLFALIVTVIGGSEGLGITCGQIVAFQLFWSAIAAAVPIIKRRIDR